MKIPREFGSIPYFPGALPSLFDVYPPPPGHFNECGCFAHSSCLNIAHKLAEENSTPFLIVKQLSVLHSLNTNTASSPISNGTKKQSLTTTEHYSQTSQPRPRRTPMRSIEF
uniref:Uncharacterized protein n=1 Tax=Globodera rostochiensis TaxID=31243 RepID=A0A914HZG4_GLORO